MALPPARVAVVVACLSVGMAAVFIHRAWDDSGWAQSGLPRLLVATLALFLEMAQQDTKQSA
jgi:hypothetical protein